MGDDLYRQCRLMKGEKEQVTWLPVEFAVEGKTLRLRKELENGCFRSYTAWDDGWLVVEAGEEAVPERSLHEQEHRFYRRMREGGHQEVVWEDYWG